MTPPDPDPTEDDYRRADLLIEAGSYGSPGPSELRDIFARGIAIARTGGDVRAYLRRELT